MKAVHTIERLVLEEAAKVFEACHPDRVGLADDIRFVVRLADGRLNVTAYVIGDPGAFENRVWVDLEMGTDFQEAIQWLWDRARRNGWSWTMLASDKGRHPFAKGNVGNEEVLS